MASTNQSPQYQKANAKFLEAQTNKDKIFYLEEMIRECPKHKSAEKMLAQLKIRRKKLLKKIEKGKKIGKSGSVKNTIKKDDMQAMIVGFTNTGKSLLLKILTNANPQINENQFSTHFPTVGIMNYAETQIQLIENPAIESEYYNKGLTNTADVLLILVNDLNQIGLIQDYISTAKGKKIIVFNLKEDKDERKLRATLNSKKYNFVLVNLKIKQGLEELKEKLFNSFDKIRVYTKEPKKIKSQKPLLLKPNSTVLDVAKKVLKNINSLKETKIWGPSSKFSGQKVGLKHQLKDLDVIEFHTR